MTDSPEIVVNKPMVDWLTSTTFEEDVWMRSIKQIATRDPYESKPRNKGGYKGVQEGQVFYGQGTQKDVPHYIITVSGGSSDRVYREIIPGFEVKRIDLQVTVEKPDGYNHRDVVRVLRSGHWNGRRRKVPMREDGDGGSTVYIGSPKSDKLIRLYVKERLFLRFEVQYRRMYARDAARIVLNGGESAISAILASEMDRLPSHHVWDEFRGILDGSQNVISYIAEPSKVKRLHWLESLLPALRQMASDHDYGETVRSWLEDIANEPGE